jgi:hypothetical protein
MEVVPRVVVKKFVVLLSICLTTPDLEPQNTDVGTSLTVNYGRCAQAKEKFSSKYMIWLNQILGIDT